MTANKNRRWTEDDERRLLELKAAGRSAVSISAALKRSVSTIKGRAGVIRARERIAKAEREIIGLRGHHVGRKGI
jgi:uncharacterized protein (DUF2252 family)